MRTKILFALLALLLMPRLAAAYTVRVHVYAANGVLQDVVDDGYVTLDSGYGLYRVDPELREALTRYPEFYRGGAIGPDGYPDIFTGQVATHADQSAGLVEYLLANNQLSCRAAEQRGWCQACDTTKPQGQRCAQPKDALVPYSWNDGGARERPKQFWRSIDWARFLIESAQKELGEANLALDAAGSDASDVADARAQRDRALQALAFAHGYLTHYSGDGFGHGWVNQYAGGAWDYFDSHPEHEYRHVIVEGFLQRVFEGYPTGDPTFPKLPEAARDLSIDAPDWFVEKYLMAEVVSGEGSASPKSLHIRLLYGYGEVLDQFEEKLGLDQPLPDELRDVQFGVDDPRYYTSVWTYLSNRCIADFALGVANVDAKSSCVVRLYHLALREYIKERRVKLAEAKLGWVNLSTEIMRQGFLSDGFQATKVTALLNAYYTERILPLVMPGENEMVHQFFSGFSCRDVGPKNFVAVCEALMDRVAAGIAKAQLELEAELAKKFEAYTEAFDTYLCTLRDFLDRYNTPERRMNYAYCGGESVCEASQLRMDQIYADLIGSMGVSGASAQELSLRAASVQSYLPNDPRSFLPFQATVRMSKMALLDQFDLEDLVETANGMDFGTVPVIDPTGAQFLNDSNYQRVLYESIATLDGTDPEGAETLTYDPAVLLFDQYRKAPVFGLIKNAAAKQRLHWPLFRISEQDPDGDQLLMSFDICPCWPESRLQNERDEDHDRVGDGCDGDWLFENASNTIRALPDAGFGPPAYGIKQSMENRFENTVNAACQRDSAAAAVLHLENTLVEIRAHHDNGLMDDLTYTAVTRLVNGLLEQFARTAIHCADSPPAGTVVTTCGG